MQTVSLIGAPIITVTGFVIYIRMTVSRKAKPKFYSWCLLCVFLAVHGICSFFLAPDSIALFRDLSTWEWVGFFLLVVITFLHVSNMPGWREASERLQRWCLWLFLLAFIVWIFVRADFLPIILLCILALPTVVTMKDESSIPWVCFGIGAALRLTAHTNARGFEYPVDMAVACISLVIVLGRFITQKFLSIDW